MQRLDELLQLHQQLGSMLTEQVKSVTTSLQEVPDEQALLATLEDVSVELNVAPEEAARTLVQRELDAKALFEVVSAIDSDIARLKCGEDQAAHAPAEQPSMLGTNSQLMEQEIEALEQRIAVCQLDDARRKELLREATALVSGGDDSRASDLWGHLANLESQLHEQQSG